ncbi:hypothetical protein [Actinomadura sp. 6N118]|uniref:hypothetical protein n=1 Tax=Actinomadura sp. 6N118 TaxID=3375151 RepID=UPI00378B5EC8
MSVISVNIEIRGVRKFLRRVGPQFLATLASFSSAVVVGYVAYANGVPEDTSILLAVTALPSTLLAQVLGYLGIRNRRI